MEMTTHRPLPSLLEAASDILYVPLDVAVCGGILGTLCVLSALFGNGLIIVTVLKDKTLRKRQNVYVVCMAAAEIVIVWIRDILMIGTYFMRFFVFGSKVCAMLVIIDTCRNVIAVGHIVALTVYRYALIVHPRAYRFISRTWFMVCLELFIVLFPLSSGIATFQGLFTDVFYYNTKGMMPIRQSRLESAIQYNMTEPDAGTNPLVMVFGYLLINVAILSVCYIHIYVFIQRSKKRLQNWGKDSTDAKADKQAKSKDVKFIKTMAIIFVTFTFSYFWTPILAAVDETMSLNHWIYFPFVMVNWFSSSINWIVYGLTHPAFNQGFRKVLRIHKKGPNAVEDISHTGTTAL